MGWTNIHLHQFEIDGEPYGDPGLLEDDLEDSTAAKLRDIVPEDVKSFRFTYEYDFGDDWEHEILFEGCLPAEKDAGYPLCIDGRRACPPEDVGGVYGYAEFLEAMANPKHGRHEELKEWSGDFDPVAFDAQSTTQRMHEGVMDWR